MIDMQNNPVTFKPSFWRFFTTRAAAYCGAYPIGMAIGMFASNSFKLDFWLVSSAVAVLLGVVLSLISSATQRNTQIIVIEDGEVNGPSRKGRCTIPLEQVNIATSRQRGVLQVILGQYQIRSMDGSSITIDGLAHSSKRFNDMLNTISTMRGSAAMSK